MYVCPFLLPTTAQTYRAAGNPLPGGSSSQGEAGLQSLRQAGQHSCRSGDKDPQSCLAQAPNWRNRPVSVPNSSFSAPFCSLCPHRLPYTASSMSGNALYILKERFGSCSFSRTYVLLLYKRAAGKWPVWTVMRQPDRKCRLLTF